nr:ARID DNA-binding domain-containing protein [Tanacetum cinerariifolium]
MATKDNLGEVVTTCERDLGFKPRRGGFPSGAKKEWGLSPKAKVRVLHTGQLDVTSKNLGRPLRKILHYDFILRQLKREKEAKLGNCIRQITHDCKDMLRKKLEEIELYNSTISQNGNRKQKCYKCRQRGHIIKNCPMKEKEHGEGTKMAGNTSILTKGQESAKLMNKELMITKPTISLKYPEWIHFSTKCMIKGTDQGHWDDIWYISSNTNMLLCSKLKIFCNIKESFAVSKLDDQMKFLFTYGIGEVVVKNGDQGYLIPGVHYGPEVTLNILSIDLSESQGIEIIYEDNIYTNNEGMKPVGMLSMEDDLIEIKGTIYSTRVNTFNEYVGFFNMLKQDEIISQEWDFSKIGEILGLSIQDGEEVRRCYINFLDVFTSYYKTAMVPKQEHNPVLGMPTKIVEEGKEYTCLASHQCDFAEIKAPNMEAASRKGKEKIEHFRIILEDTRRESDSHHFQPIQPNIKRSQTMNKDIQGMILEGILLEV